MNNLLALIQRLFQVFRNNKVEVSDNSDALVHSLNKTSKKNMAIIMHLKKEKTVNTLSDLKRKIRT